jgi:hypothetical protein
MTARLRGTDGVAATLAAGFDAFEVIRAAARDCEDRASELFAAFMMAAGSAVEGRNALAAAPSLTRRGGQRGCCRGRRCPGGPERSARDPPAGSRSSHRQCQRRGGVP